MVTASGLLRLMPLLLIATCLASCARDEAPDSTSAPAKTSFEPDAAVEYANRATQTDHYYREGYFERNGIRLHYVEAGEGDLAILYHGFPSFR